MVTVERAELRESIQRRFVETREGESVRLFVQLSRPLPADRARRLREEVAAVAAAPIEGLVAPRTVQIEDQGVRFELDAIHPGALRLSDLLLGLTESQTSMGDGLAAALTATAAQLCHSIHLAPGVHGRARVHGACHPGNLVLTPVGSVALIGTGLPLIDALLLPSLPGAEARHTAPEVAARREPDLRADVYGLGVLFLTLLSGQTPWADASPQAHYAALASGQLRNPGVSLADPRPSLVEVLRRAMSPSPGPRFGTALALGQAISNELKASGRPRADAGALQHMLSDRVPAQAPRGAFLLGEAGAPPRQAALPPAPTPELHGWSHILDDAPPAAPAPTQPAAAPAPPIRLPTPGAVPARPGPERAPTRQPVAKITLPAPAAPGAAPQIRLPLPSGSAPSAAAAPGLAVDPSVLDALHDPDVPRQDRSGTKGAQAALRATHPEAHDGSAKRNLIAGGVLVLGLFGVWLLRGPAGAEADAPDATVAGVEGAVPTPFGMIPTDAGLAPVVAAPPPPPDAGPAPTKPIGFLTVFSTPSGATVQLDGGYVGKTPLVLKHTFKDQVYELTILNEGYLPWTKSLRPDPDRKSINAMAVLEKK